MGKAGAVPCAAPPMPPGIGPCRDGAGACCAGWICWGGWPLHGISVPRWWLSKVTNGEPSAMEITTIGLDLAKHVFQVHGMAADGSVVLKKRLRRGQVHTFFAGLKPCLVGMEACATAHFWARELRALGHDVRLMPAQYVKAYVRRGKNDAADAAAICEAVTRPSMRFVLVKEEAQQAGLMLHRVRDLLIRQRTHDPPGGGSSDRAASRARRAGRAD